MSNVTNSFVHRIYYPEAHQPKQTEKYEENIILAQLCAGEVDNNTLYALSKLTEYAAEGDLDSIELLYNISLQNSLLGKKAEDALFNIFSQKIEIKNEADEKVQQMGLQLYKIHPKQATELETQSKLLYITGSAIRDDLKKLDTSENQYEQIKTEYQSLLKTISDQLKAGSDIWDSNRLIDSDELVSGMQAVLENPERFSLNYPIQLITLNTQLVQKQKQEQLSKPEEWLSKTECFALHHHDHWIFFALYKYDNKTQAIVFNSWNKLDNHSRAILENAAKNAGAESINYVEKNLQEHVWNGCGLFVIDAMRNISDSPDKDPIRVLEDMANIFLTNPIEKQEKFNITGRRQLYEMHIEEQTKKKTEIHQLTY